MSRAVFLTGLVALCLSVACDGRVIVPKADTIDHDEAPRPPAANPDVGNPKIEGLPPPPPFDAFSTYAQVGKVKMLLVGGVATDAEVAAVEADPKAWGPLIDGWMSSAAFRGKMLGFFRNAFQQGQIGYTDLSDHLGIELLGSLRYGTWVARSFQESFARTVLQLIDENRPFTETVTTRRFMLTPPLMSILAFIDILHNNDAGKVTWQYPADFWRGGTDVRYEVMPGSTAIPYADSANPSSPNFMKWRNLYTVPAQPTPQATTSCSQFPRQYADLLAGPSVYYAPPSSLLMFVFGRMLANVSALSTNDDTVGCRFQIDGPSLFSDADFSAWRMVNIRPPKDSEPVTRFYDIARLQPAKELVLKIPRVGFFSTPAFFANWPTNESNQSRVSVNQTLIAALGRGIELEDQTVPSKAVAPDPDHGKSGSECYQCHLRLDPLKDLYRRFFTLHYHEQKDSTATSKVGLFTFRGISKQVATLDEFAQTLASHPLFAGAWVQKLCWWANSMACAEDDPEFVRVARAFEGSHFNFKVLVRELFSSPLITAARNTSTFETYGVSVALARREHFCANLSNRLNLPDACGLTPADPIAPPTPAAKLAGAIPADGYARGASTPAMPTQPNLFFRSSVEQICRTLAMNVVDSSSSLFSSTQLDKAFDDLAQKVIGVSSKHPARVGARAVLVKHYQEAMKQTGVTATDALRSTFMLACVAPSNTAVGF